MKYKLLNLIELILKLIKMDRQMNYCLSSGHEKLVVMRICLDARCLLNNRPLCSECAFNNHRSHEECVLISDIINKVNTFEITLSTILNFDELVNKIENSLIYVNDADSKKK